MSVTFCPCGSTDLSVNDCPFCTDHDEDSNIGCFFPGRCCMPGVHMFSECHTAEMMEQMIENGEA